MTPTRLTVLAMFVLAAVPLAAQLPELTLWPAVTVVQENEGPAEIQVLVSTPPDSPARFRVSTVDGTAQAGEDYVAVVAKKYETTSETKIRVSIVDDNLAEPDETFYVDITDVENAKATTTRVAVTIKDDGVLPAPEFGRATAVEGDGYTTTVNVYLSIPYTLHIPMTLHVTSAPITARARVDYVPVDTNVIFNPGSRTAMLPVTIYGDDEYEADETFALYLEGTASTAIFTIEDDDEPSTLPLVTIDDATVFERTGEPALARFRVTLAEPPLHGARVSYETVDWTAKAGDDFDETTGVLVFAPGQVLNWIEIPIFGDDRDEQSEFFDLHLKLPAGASLQDDMALGTIRDDDAPAARYLWVHDAIAVERTGATSTAVFRLELSSASSQPVEVKYAIADLIEGPSRATLGRDFAGGVVNTLIFAPGEMVKEVSVPIFGDADVEGDEFFGLFLQPVSGLTERPFPGKGTIIDDDRAWPWPQLRVDDTRAVETDGWLEIPVTLTLARASETAALVTVETRALTAQPFEDFLPQRVEVTFEPGETTKTVLLRVIGDNAEERMEHFAIDLSAADGLAIVRDSATVTILDDDGPLSRRRPVRH